MTTQTVQQTQASHNVALAANRSAKKAPITSLTEQEVAQVGGGFGFPGAALGAFAGGAGYLGGVAGGGRFSFSGLGSAVAFGALGGAMGGGIASAAMRYAMPRVSFGQGFFASRIRR